LVSASLGCNIILVFIPGYHWQRWYQDQGQNFFYRGEKMVQSSSKGPRFIRVQLLNLIVLPSVPKDVVPPIQSNISQVLSVPKDHTTLANKALKVAEYKCKTISTIHCSGCAYYGHLVKDCYRTALVKKKKWIPKRRDPMHI
jgi:hypothetical protein